MQEPGSEAKKANGMAHVLASLATSGSAWVQLGTLALIGLSGLGNWIATWNSANENKAQIEINRRVAWEGEQRIRDDVRREIQEIHEWIRESKDDFEKGNRDSAANRKMLGGIVEEIHAGQENQTKLLENQTALLRGQKVVLENDAKILAEIARALSPLRSERAYPSPGPDK